MVLAATAALATLALSAGTAVAQQADTTAYVKVANIPLDAVGEWDVNKSRTRTNFDYQRLVYDGLLRWTADGKLEPGLAKAVDLVDPSTLKITLRPDVKFSDGSAFDAAAVVAGLQRTVNGKNLTGVPAECFQMTDIQATDASTVTVKLAQPIAGAVRTYLAGSCGVIVSKQAADAGNNFDTNPIGAGPYTLEEYKADAVLKLKKNPTYFQAKNVKNAGLEFVRTGGDPAAIANGLRGGQIDVAALLGYTDAQNLKTAKNLKLLTKLDPNGVISNVWCKSAPPLDKPEVRKALIMATDRDAINQVVFANTGETAWGLYNKANALFDPKQVGVNKYNVKAAKKLLADNGYPNGFDLGMYVAGQPGSDVAKVAEVLQQQWKQVGVNLSIESTLNALSDFYANHKKPVLILNDTSDNLVRQYGTPQAVANVCQYTDPKFVDPLLKLNTLERGSPEYKAQLSKVETIVNEDAIKEYLVFPPNSTAFASKLGGQKLITSTLGRPFPDYTTLYVKKGS
jgi:peptide/nickel transport system substrate-binding protein